MLSMYLTSVPFRAALKQKLRSNVNATSIKLGHKQIAVHSKLPKPFGDIICMTKRVSSTDWET